MQLALETNLAESALIETLEHLKQNIRWLDMIRLSGRGTDAAEYRRLIDKGIRFVPYVGGNGLGFAPSKFVGYMSNEFSVHDRAERHGSDTTRRIDRILGGSARASPEVLELFRGFCRSLGFDPSDSGAFGNERAFWRFVVLDQVAGEAGDDAILGDPGLSNTEMLALVLARRGHGTFREDLRSYWQGRCCVTRITENALLRASHIRPWAVSDNRQRLDHFNGLLLAVHLDALFDRGFISFAPNGRLMISERMSPGDLGALNVHDEMKVALEEDHQPYLAYHRENVFKAI